MKGRLYYPYAPKAQWVHHGEQLAPPTRECVCVSVCEGDRRFQIPGNRNWRENYRIFVAAVFCPNIICVCVCGGGGTVVGRKYQQP